MGHVPPQDRMAFGQGAEDFNACLRELGTYYRKKMSAITVLRFVYTGLIVTLVLTWIVAVFLMLSTVDASELPRFLTSLGMAVSAGGAVLGAVGLQLHRMEREVCAYFAKLDKAGAQ
jgi:hypothetical protein